ATRSRSSSPECVRCTAWKWEESLTARDCATLGSLSRTTTLKPIDPPDYRHQRRTRAAGKGSEKLYSTDITTVSTSTVGSLPVGRRLFRRRLKRLGLELPVLLQQDFYLAFSLFQLLAAGGREVHPFFKESERLFQRHISLFQFLNNFFQPLETLFKLGQRGFTPSLL